MSRTFRTPWVGAALLTIIVIGRASNVLAVDKTYVGGPGTGQWSLNTNWSPFGVPRDFDNVLLAPSDANGRIVVFDGAGSLAFDYGGVTIRPGGPGTMGLHNAGAFFAALSITVDDRGEYRTTTDGARTVVGSVRLI